MKKLFKKFIPASLLLAMCILILSCGKTIEKTTIIKENNPPQEPNIQLTIDTGKSGIEMKSRKK